MLNISKIIVFVLGTLALSSCIEADSRDLQAIGSSDLTADVVATSTESIFQITPPRIGDFCIIEQCATVPGDPDPGDDECRAATGVGGACCIEGICNYGVRFGGSCFALTPPEDGSETCPNDANDNGFCVYNHVWYTLCPWAEPICD